MAEYLTDTEAAIIAGVTVGFLRQQLLAGNLKGTQFGRSWTIMPADLQTWMYSGRRGGSPKDKPRKSKEEPT